jgi:aryl-alcohol dehydrogenase-like predicted oxidoreductase
MANRVLTDENFGVLGKLESFAQQRGKTILDLAMGWLASNEQVASIIAGATRPEQVEQNVRSSEWRLTKEEMAEVASITRA